MSSLANSSTNNFKLGNILVNSIKIPNNFNESSAPELYSKALTSANIYADETTIASGAQPALSLAPYDNNGNELDISNFGNKFRLELSGHVTATAACYPIVTFVDSDGTEYDADYVKNTIYYRSNATADTIKSSNVTNAAGILPFDDITDAHLFNISITFDCDLVTNNRRIPYIAQSGVINSAGGANINEQLSGCSPQLAVDVTLGSIIIRLSSTNHTGAKIRYKLIRI